jgi:ABC-type multidrug transport system fused ATPase/permease subunit
LEIGPYCYATHHDCDTLRRLPPTWPDKGRIELDRISVRYRPFLPLAIQDVSLTILPGEKIGVCGRTGSGKTTLMSVLFRLVECEAGEVRIDGYAIQHIGTRRLRPSIAVVPQV